MIEFLLYPHHQLSRSGRHLGLVLILIFGITGCETTGVRPSGQFAHGAFVVNEGGFGSGNGTITFMDPAGKVNQNVFRNSQGDFAGDVLLSLYFSDDRGFIVANGDSKIETMEDDTFKGMGTIVDPALDKPRYLVEFDNKAYISVWGPYDASFALVDSYVLVWDLSKGEVIKKLDTDEGTEELLLSGGLLFASNFNYGASQTVAMIDPMSDELIGQLTVEPGPSGMVEDADGKVWVICTGEFGEDNGALVRIDPLTRTVEKTVPLKHNIALDNPNLATSRHKDALIYMVGNDVYSLSIDATEAPDAPLFTASQVIYPYALGVNPDNGDIWIGDAVNFTSTGKVYVYSSSGDAVENFECGIGPTQFVFK